MFTLTDYAESSTPTGYFVINYFLGDDVNGNPAVWEEMPAPGQVVSFFGYYFVENGVPTLRGYSGENGEKGRSVILLTDNCGEITVNEGAMYCVTAAVELAEAWSGAPRRIAAGDDEAFTNLRAQVIAVDDASTTGISDQLGNHDVLSVRYINVAGVQSDKPFDGVNIVVTKFVDGTTKAVKVVK